MRVVNLSPLLQQRPQKSRYSLGWTFGCKLYWYPKFNLHWLVQTCSVQTFTPINTIYKRDIFIIMCVWQLFNALSYNIPDFILLHMGALKRCSASKNVHLLILKHLKSHPHKHFSTLPPLPHHLSSERPSQRNFNNFIWNSIIGFRGWWAIFPAFSKDSFFKNVYRYN